MFAAPLLLIWIGFLVWGGVVLTRSARQRFGGGAASAGRHRARAGRAAAPADGRAVARGEGGSEELDPAVWAFQQLVRLGIDPVTALGAALAGVDCAAVRSLVERGCPAALALSILAPDEVSVRTTPSA